MQGSYKGETGSFRGLEPIFLSFAIRNSGNSPVRDDNEITAKILLSEDVLVDPSDFILREFNLGGNGLGQGMLAGETINLTWFQQLPDNFEGDYYILIELQNNHLDATVPSRIKVESLDSTPILTLESQDKGLTDLVETSLTLDADSNLVSLIGQARGFEQQILAQQVLRAQYPELAYAYDQVIRDLESQRDLIVAQIAALSSPSERPDVSKSGRYIVFEKRMPAGEIGAVGSNAFQQIFYLDMQQLNPTPKLVSRAYGTPDSNNAANGDSFRPRISDDGSTIVFHSRANNLVPGDLNGKEDIFIYQISTKTLRRIVNDATGLELNGRSLYPDVNGDGSRIVFETDATNAQANGASTTGRQVFLWSRKSSGGSEIVALTSGTEPSTNPSIDEAGNRIVFESFANLLAGGTKDDNNTLKDVYLIDLESNASDPSNTPGTDYFADQSIELTVDGALKPLTPRTYLVNLNFRGSQTQKNDNSLNPGHSYNARISGNGERIVFESSAQNLISGTGIAKVVVTEGGFGYQGTPRIEITDENFNSKAAP